MDATLNALNNASVANTANNLPEMDFKFRESETAHGIKPPNQDATHRLKQLNEAINLNEYAKVDGWDEGVFDILRDYIPLQFTNDEAAQAIYDVTGFKSWAELCNFVKDDECVDLFGLLYKYCKKEGQPKKPNRHNKEELGSGAYEYFINEMQKYIEMCFDAKYFFKQERPLVASPVDLTKVANAIHPGHYAYPAGHGCKFLTAVKVLRELFNLDGKCDSVIILVACIAAMARSGLLVHFLEDNLATGELIGLPEFCK